MLNFKYFSFSSYLKTLFLSMSLIGSTTQASEIIDCPINLDKGTRAVQKVKRIFETMQARESDYVTITEAFVNKFSDPKCDLKEKFDIIDPFWSQLAAKKSNKTTTRNKLTDQLNLRKRVIVLAQEEFQGNSIRAKNAIQGFQKIINMCDQYLDSQSTQTLQLLLDSILGSHLLGLKTTVDKYVSSSGINYYSHASFKKDEFDKYYTQDLRLNLLAEIYYIVDYIHPISTLMKLGLIPDALDWSFAENLKKYINGSLTLDDPSMFLLDGFLYKKGIEKANKSLAMLKKLAYMNSSMDTGGTFEGGMIEVQALLDSEKQSAMDEYAMLYQTHRNRVKSYIQSLTFQNINNIKKSKTFLEFILGENSQFSSAPILITTETSSKLDLGKPQKNHKKRNKKKKHLATPVQRQTELSSEKVIIAPSPVVEIPNRISPQSIEMVAQLHEDTQIASSITENYQETKVLHDNDTTSVIEPLQLHPVPKPKYQAVIKVDEKNNGRKTINNKSRSILINILDLKTSPFTISYAQALNAMSKIDILEIQPKRKGDFRKLVRLDANGDVIAKVFAYRPATSTLGNELMKIYRIFINQQLNDRNDIDLK